ncbi:MAG TPA: coniferyl aldehyde dehydrogenase [Steroidobacteraceae bacterium]|nr:coniferyl aldehyde dehydrogenase [Steroidobacteraceae bacterium]
MALPIATPIVEHGARLEALLAEQRAAFQAEGETSAPVRIERLERGLDLLVSHQQEFCATLAEDFGRRPADLTRFADILPAVLAFKNALRHVRRWMRPQRCRPALPAGAPGVRAYTVYQALGVVGVLSPWNFPVNLTFGPLAGILAAGNRCLIKPSELTPATADLIQRRVSKYYEPSEVAVVTGGPELAQAFAKLPFDHLLFTGSTNVGGSVMRAAAEHLVPVTLELGGKCPAVIGRSADLQRAVDRILLGKLVNAGQMCLAPDYLLVPAEAIVAFVDHARAWMAQTYPHFVTNPDYTTLISERHARRIEGLLAEARSKGATLISLAPEAPGAARLIAPTLVLGATDDMQLMQQEIFGPVLPLRPYRQIDEAIAEINSRPRPLALYYFGSDSAEERQLLDRTRSGGVTVNDVAMHFLAQELPFGGVGASGMGAYHGWHGFQRFSHARAVFRQTRLDVAGLVGLRPPYGKRLQQSLRLLIRR